MLTATATACRVFTAGLAACLMLACAAACPAPDPDANVTDYLVPGLTLPGGTVIDGDRHSKRAYQTGYVKNGDKLIKDSIAVWFNHCKGWVTVSQHVRARMKLAGLKEAGGDGSGAGGSDVGGMMLEHVDIYESPDGRYLTSLYNTAAINQAQPGFMPPFVSNSQFLLVVIEHEDTAGSKPEGTRPVGGFGPSI